MPECLVTVMSNSLQPHELQPNRLLCSLDSLGKYPGVGSLFPTQELNPNLQHCKQILYCLSHQGSLTLIPSVLICFTLQNNSRCFNEYILNIYLFVALINGVFHYKYNWLLVQRNTFIYYYIYPAVQLNSLKIQLSLDFCGIFVQDTSVNHPILKTTDAQVPYKKQHSILGFAS